MGAAGRGAPHLPARARAMTPRRLVLSRTGRWCAIRTGDEVELVDLLGATANRGLAATRGDLGFVGRELWMLDRAILHRLAPDDLRPLPPNAIVPGIPERILAGYGHDAREAILIGPRPCLVQLRGETLVVEPLDDLAAGDRVLALHGARMIVAGADGLRALERGRGVVWRVALAGEIAEASILFGGRAVAARVRGADGDRFVVLRSTGASIHSIPVPAARRAVFAEELGHAFVVGADGLLTRVDLRYGRVHDPVRAPIEVVDLQVDEAGRHMVVIGAEADGAEVLHLVVSDVFRAENRVEAPAEEAEPPSPRATRPRAPDAADQEAPPSAAPSATASIELPDLVPLALGPPPPLGPAARDGGESPYLTARAHLDAMLDLVAARTALAIADAWNSGRLSAPNTTGRPHELEVGALLGGIAGFAPEKLTETKTEVDRRQREASARATASAARGIRLPFPDLVREVGLGPIAAQILLLVAAPALRGEISRLYAVLGNDPHRPLVDRFLVEQIVGEKSVLRDQIARELAADSPLVRHGLVAVGSTPSTSLFAPLSVPDALLDRLRGLAPARVDDVSLVRGAERRLERLHLPDEIKRELILALAEPRAPHDPLRLVLRGRRGSGRHSLIAALADRVGRSIVAIDTTRMPRGPRDLIAALRGALFRASVHGLIPVLSGLEQVEPTDADLRELIRQVVRVHPGPLLLRTSPESTLPIDPGFLSITLPNLNETERSAAWRELLAEAELRADADGLAARYRIGPGVIATVVAQVAGRGRTPGGATAALDEQVGQHVATRLNHVAARITRTSAWEDVALPEEMLDSLREFIGRARHRRTVYERWGYDSKLSTARGLTALFYGPPGTGKSMVAGVIARDLGLDLYRVDLARVVSKWVGETEKNLAEVFDAAEDGQVLVLFDEADSLFAKRTDVKTSNDRYANLEVNYLLQRLDTFEGIAILTSNLDSAIDPAFRRRLSLRLQFPFPDEEMRVRLWAAHMTPQTPTVGDFDFLDLAQRFPLSGGYIRNCAVRAAFLAAHEDRPLSQEHLLRAIHLEYRELGKLSTSSRIE